MPLSDQELTRELASLKETMQEFRNEMRMSMAGVVRNDVYQAQQETMKAQTAQHLEQIRGELNQLRGRIESMETDKRQNKGLIFGALASAAVSLLMTILSFNK